MDSCALARHLHHTLTLLRAIEIRMPRPFASQHRHSSFSMSIGTTWYRTRCEGPKSEITQVGLIRGRRETSWETMRRAGFSSNKAAMIGGPEVSVSVAAD
jgi:hypothetical protein